MGRRHFIQIQQEVTIQQMELMHMYFNTTGSDNIAIGNAAGYNLTTGSNNIFIGYYSAGKLKYSFK